MNLIKLRPNEEYNLLNKFCLKGAPRQLIYLGKRHMAYAVLTNDTWAQAYCN